MWHNYNYLIEYREVLRKVSSFMLNKPRSVNRLSNPFGSSDEEAKGKRHSSGEQLFGRASESSEEDHPIDRSIQQIKTLNLGSLAGIVFRNDIERMKRIIFRASRGNALIHTIPIDYALKEYSGKEMIKEVFIITFQEGESLRDKLTRIIESF